MSKVGPNGYVYALSVADRSRVKIGHTCVAPTHRIRAVERAVGEPLTCTAVVSSAYAHGLETALHAMFADVALGKEWFALDADDLQQFASLAAFLEHHRSRPLGLVHSPYRDRLADQALGQRLIRVREAQGWTLQKLARRSLIPLDDLHGYEQGAESLPLVMSIRLARSLGIDLNYLGGFYDEGETD